MDQSLHIIEEALKTARSPVILSSFGKDSLLLAKLVHEFDPSVPILWFRDNLNPFAARTIREQDLQVFGYSPVDRYFVPNEDGLMLVDEFVIGEGRIPVLRDVVQGDHCDVERLPSSRTRVFSYPWDVTFFGFKASDAQKHFVTSNTVLPLEFNLGHTRMISPLHHLTDSDVLAAIQELNIFYEERDDSLRMCQQCFDSLSDWDRAASLSAFRSRFGFKVH